MTARSVLAPGLSSSNLASYVDDLYAAVQRVLQVQPPITCDLHVASQQIRLRFAGAALIPALLPALAHLQTKNGAASSPTITFDLWESSTSDILPPLPPFVADDYRRYGQRAVAYAGEISLMHTPTANMLFAYNRTNHHGIFWTADAQQLSIYERAAPIQTLFHWALSEFGWQIIHAAAVGTTHGGALLIGNTGAGKSTTALSCLAQENIRFLCDDKCLVRLEPTPQAFALYSSGKIKADMLERLPHFRSMLTGWDDHVKAGKGLVFLYPTYAEHMATSFPIKALLLPVVTHQPQPTILPASATVVFRELGPSTVIWLPGAEAENYRFTAQLTRCVPGYRLALAQALQLNVDAIRKLILGA